MYHDDARVFLSKLYLSLAEVLPESTETNREKDLRIRLDRVVKQNRELLAKLARLERLAAAVYKSKHCPEDVDWVPLELAVAECLDACFEAGDVQGLEEKSKACQKCGGTGHIQAYRNYQPNGKEICPGCSAGDVLGVGDE